MGTAQSRKEKIEWLKEQIERFFKERPDKMISKDRLVSEFIIAHSSTKRTAIELIDSLQQTEIIKIDGDNILNGSKSMPKV